MVLAVSGPLRSEDVLAAALELASSFKAPLIALYVEDVNLVRFSGLPFAQELDRASGALRPLDPERLGRAMASEAQRLNERLQLESQSRRVSVSLEVVRGHWVSSAVRLARSRDIVVVDAEVRTPAGRSKSARWEQPIWVLCDGSGRTRRALTLALELGNFHVSDIVVAADKAALEAGLGEQLGSVAGGGERRIRLISLDDNQAVSTAAEKYGAAILVAPREMIDPGVADRVTAILGCPRILV